MPKLKCWTINAQPSTPSECNWLPFNNIDFCLKNGILVSSLHYHVTDYSLSFSLSQHTFRFLATSTDCRSAFMLQVKCNRSSTNIKAFWRWKRNTHKQHTIVKCVLSEARFNVMKWFGVNKCLPFWYEASWTCIREKWERSRLKYLYLECVCAIHGVVNSEREWDEERDIGR